MTFNHTQSPGEPIMANLSEILGALMQAEPSQSTNTRLQSALGAGGQADTSSLEGLLKGTGLDEVLSGLMGGGQGGGGIGSILSGALEKAGQAAGGKENLAIGAIGALLGSVLGGGTSSAKGAIGGGALAALGALAYNALKGTHQEPQEVPLGLRKPASAAEKDQLEGQAGLVIKAMINAAKADGQIDRDEIQRIIGKLGDAGIDQKAVDFVTSEMNKPMDTEELVAAAKGNPQLGAQLYAASLLSIEVDTPGERAYLENFANSLGLVPKAVTNLENTMGVK
jgi:uncharacterized membrane protein YebE (DUF533 family)